MHKPAHSIIEGYISLAEDTWFLRQSPVPAVVNNTEKALSAFSKVSNTASIDSVAGQTKLLLRGLYSLPYQAADGHRPNSSRNRRIG